MGLLNNYHVNKKPMQTVAVKEVFFQKTSGDTKINTKTNKTNKKGKPKFFHCGDPDKWA